jgi:hypothetical protein
LPDLDEESEREQEKRIQAALFWGLLTGIVEFDAWSKPSVYRLRFADGSSGDMVVSNGTDCDNLYEVLDSLTISPLNVTRILDQIHAKIERQRFLKKPIHKALLREKLDDFELDEFPRPEGVEPKTRSIFDIAMLMQKSKPVDDYQVDELRRLMLTIFEEIRTYLKGYLTEDDLPSYYGMLIYNQAALFIRGLAMENQVSAERLQKLTEVAKEQGLPLPEEVPEWNGVYNDELFRTLMQLTESELTACYLDDEADELRKLARDLLDRRRVRR